MGGCGGWPNAMTTKFSAFHRLEINWVPLRNEAVRKIRSECRRMRGRHSSSIVTTLFRVYLFNLPLICLFLPPLRDEASIILGWIAKPKVGPCPLLFECETIDPIIKMKCKSDQISNKWNTRTVWWIDWLIDYFIESLDGNFLLNWFHSFGIVWERRWILVGIWCWHEMSLMTCQHSSCPINKPLDKTPSYSANCHANQSAASVTQQINIC